MRLAELTNCDRQQCVVKDDIALCFLGKTASVTGCERGFRQAAALSPQYCAPYTPTFARPRRD